MEEKQDRWADPRQEVEKLEDDPPKRLEDWPDGKAKYVTFRGGEGDHGYEEGPEKNLGPSSLRRFEDGRVTVEGEEVDDPDATRSDDGPVELSVDIGDARKKMDG